MIAKLHNVFLWFALAISVCIGFSGTVTADEATECRLTSVLDFSSFPPSQRAKLKKFLPKKITAYPSRVRIAQPRLHIDWKSHKNTLMADVENKLSVRYKCNGLARSLPSSGFDPHDVARNKPDRALCQLAVTNGQWEDSSVLQKYVKKQNVEV